MWVVLSPTLKLVDLFVAVLQVTVSVPIMQLEASAAPMQVNVSAVNMLMTIFIEIIQAGACCNHADGIFCSALHT